MMLDHAVSCGTLLSYLTTLDQTTQQEYFAALLALRKQPKRWTEIPEPARSRSRPGDLPDGFP